MLKVLPEQIASQLKGLGVEERISKRSGEQTVDLPVPQVMESVELQIVRDIVPQILKDVLDGVEHVPQEWVQNRVVEHIAAVHVSQIMEECVG